jgi:hypothetical protein
MIGEERGVLIKNEPGCNHVVGIFTLLGDSTGQSKENSLRIVPRLGFTATPVHLPELAGGGAKPPPLE